MRALPLGVPKVMVSTLASGTVRQFVGDKDIFMLMRSSTSWALIASAGGPLAGGAGDGRARRLPATKAEASDKLLVAATMCGVTTTYVERARETLARAGCEVLVFHATGNGGQGMESLIREGVIAGRLDVTTTELADEHVGGFLSAGPDRLTTAGQMGIPQVVSTGTVKHGELLCAGYGPRQTRTDFSTDTRRTSR